MIPARLAAFFALPLARTLLLSMSMHLALIMLIQPEPGLGRPVMSVIQARLVTDPKPIEPVPLPEPKIEPVLEPDPLPVHEPDMVFPTEPPIEPMPTVPETLEPMQPVSEPESKEEPQAGQVESASVAPVKPSDEEALPTVPLMVDTRWYTARELDVQPLAKGSILPVYPELAQKEGVTGSVVLTMRIDEFGMVQDISVESATPEGTFDESALEAFRAARFVPARLAGRTVRSEIRIRVTYSLTD